APAIVAFTVLLCWKASQWTPTRIHEGEQIVRQEEGPMGTAAVIDTAQGLRRMVVNGRYTMGDSFSRAAARRLAFLPAMLGADAVSRVFVVGLGTGITVGAVQEFAGLRGATLDVAEMMPEIARLSSYFSPWQARFGPPPTMHVADGRTVLRASTSRYDLIILDVVHPWQPGAASLYSHEAFSLLRERLSPVGRAVVWLPIFQLSSEATANIVATFVSVFPRAHLFAGGLDPSRQVLALASDTAPDVSVDRAREHLGSSGVLDDPLLSVPGALAALDLGNASDVLKQLTAGGRIQSVQIQHDDRPWLEFESARAHAEGRRMGAREFQQLLAASDRAHPSTSRMGVAVTVHHCLRAIWMDTLDSANEEAEQHLRECFGAPSSRQLARQFAGMMAHRASLAGAEARARRYELLADSAPY
ncbi:MAG TPA: hypothetical protein VFK05_32265, partial [Polyangiaceae bacterium]|nr:hypothetical protein [Polyangiaceae bacterium]